MATHDGVTEVSVDFSDVDRKIQQLSERVMALEILCNDHTLDEKLAAKIFPILYRMLTEAAKGTRQE